MGLWVIHIGTGNGTQTSGLCRNVNIGLRQGKEPGTTVSYCAGAVPCTCPGPGQCEHAIVHTARERDMFRELHQHNM